MARITQEARVALDKRVYPRLVFIEPGRGEVTWRCPRCRKEQASIVINTRMYLICFCGQRVAIQLYSFISRNQPDA